MNVPRDTDITGGEESTQIKAANKRGYKDLILATRVLFYRSTESNRRVKSGRIEFNLILYLKRTFGHVVVNIQGDLF